MESFVYEILHQTKSRNVKSNIYKTIMTNVFLEILTTEKINESHTDFRKALLVLD